MSGTNGTAGKAGRGRRGREEALVRALLEEEGRTYAEEAGVRLKDSPQPLYQLLVLSHLLSARIRADVAVAAARALFEDGLRTPRRMAEASWQERVDALGRGHYRRYDERTATQLGDCAGLLLEKYRGDLRRMREEARRRADGEGAEETAAAERELLQEAPGIGPAGADIFLREVQGVWPEVRPRIDGKALDGAARIGLPDSPGALARLVDAEDLPGLAAGLVRVALRRDAAERVREAAGV